MSPHLVKLFSTFFYMGRMPCAGGSIASAAAALIYLALYNHLDLYVLLFVLITAVGFGVSGKMENMSGEKDPRSIVIDEVSGGMIAFFLLPANFPVLITAFFVFRAFDMFKIYPAYKLEKIKGSIGVMSDDLIAGLYTCLTMHTVLWIISQKQF